MIHVSIVYVVLGSDVNKLLNFDQNIECIRKYWIRYSKHQATMNRWSYHLVWMRKHTYKVSLKEFLKLFKCLASSSIHTVSRWLDLLFKALPQERKIRKERIPTRLACVPWVVVILPLFKKIWYEIFFHKIPHNYVYIHQHP